MDRVDLIDDIQGRFRQAVGTLNERERRQWAARETLRLGRGGLSVVSLALRMSPNTIKRGLQELAGGDGLSSAESPSRIRKAGGGRKSTKPRPNA